MILPKQKSFVRAKLIGLFIALSLSVTYYYQIKQWATGIPGNSTNFWVFSAMSKANYHLDTLGIFRPRIGGLWIAGQLVDTAIKDGQLKIEDLQRVFGLYHAVWLFLCFAVLIVFLENPVFVIIGCFAGLFYALTPAASCYAYPWDMPALTFFTLAYLLWRRKHYNWMLALICFSYLFKETPMITAVLYFFTDLPKRKKILYFATAVIVTNVFIKLAVTELVMGGMKLHTYDHHIPDNIKLLLGIKWNHFIFVNAGTFMAALFLPIRSREELATKTLLVLFFIGQFLAGAINEYRIMIEALPVTLMYLEKVLYTPVLSATAPPFSIKSEIRNLLGVPSKAK